MKQITNISPKQVDVLIKQGVIFNLPPNSFIFSDEPVLSALVRIYEKKKILEIVETKKPTHLQTLRVYNGIADLMGSEVRELMREEMKKEPIEINVVNRNGEIHEVEIDDSEDEDIQEAVDKIVEAIEETIEENEGGEVEIDEEEISELGLCPDDDIPAINVEAECTRILNEELVKAIKGEANDLVIPPGNDIATNLVGDLKDEQIDLITNVVTPEIAVTELEIVPEEKPKNKGGRPKGSKNKPKGAKRGKSKKKGKPKGSKKK